jgi:transketolase
VPSLLGGSADLSGSTSLPAQADVHFGIREHAMAAILNGVALHGWFRPYGSTYLTFSDYQRPALRLAALMRLPVLHLFTHDSLAVGEDGPTHQPVEQLWSLRMTPGLDVVRPADAREVAGCWARVLTDPTGPAAMVLARQTLSQLVGSSTAGAARGGYVVRPAQNPDVLLLATGSEVALALEAASELEAHGVAAQVVSLPCLEWFDQQPADYRHSVLPAHVRARVAVEAAVEGAWHRYVGDHGRIVGVSEFGLSGDGASVMRARGITCEAVVAAALDSLASTRVGGTTAHLARTVG